ncbi:MAG TPA: hypothetical protein VNK91_01950 [Burkholderiaceae bacterium]|nr:hypothetical protein [Burkholderiaceae bacterium]
MAFSAAIGLTAFSGISQYQAQRRAGRMNQQLAEYNAELAEADALEATRRGGEGAARAQSQARRMIGTQRARLAAQGIDIESGSAADIQADTVAISEMDALTLQNNAVREALGYRTRARGYRIQGALDRARGDTEALGTLLTTGARAFGLGYRGNS